MLVYIYAVVIGFSLGIAGKPLADAVARQFERWRGERAWNRVMKTAPFATGGLNVMVLTSVVRKISPNALDVTELNLLFDAAWGSPKPGYDGVLDHSFGWVTARQDGVLVGFANIAWDGASHFFLLDTTVHPAHRDKDVATMMTKAAVRHLNGKGEWLHVDATEQLMERLYFPCGFRPTAAGLVDLRQSLLVENSDDAEC